MPLKKSKRISRKSKSNKKSNRINRKSKSNKKSNRINRKSKSNKKSKRRISRKSKSNKKSKFKTVNKLYSKFLKYKMINDNEDEHKEYRNIVQVLFSCTTYLEDSNLMTNIESVFEPFLIYSGTDKILNINMINGYKGNKEEEEKIYNISKERIKYIADKLGLNIIINPMIHERFMDHIFKMRFFYDYICFIGCNNVDFIFSFFADDDNENEKEETVIMANLIGKDKGYFDEVGFEQYAITENLNLFLKPSTKILFFERNKILNIFKYWDTLNFHKQLLIPDHRARKHADIFLKNFKLNYTINGIPYFILYN